MRDDVLRAVFEDLAVTRDHAAKSAASVLSGEIPMWVNNVEALELLRAALHTPEQVAAFAATVELLVDTALHSVLVTLDGGSASAEVGRVYLVDEDGAHAPDGLHEFFVDHLFDSGRLP